MRYLIVGGSRGLGAAFAEGLPRPKDEVLVVSRSKPELNEATDVAYEWIRADATTATFADEVSASVKERPIDALIYNAGIWEKGDFNSTPADEINAIITTNLTSCVLLVQRLLDNVIRSNGKSVILVSSTCGLENEGSQKVAYVASKFGLRGVGQSLREVLRKHDGKVSVISPGSIASDVPLSAGAKEAIDRHGGTRIPVGDFVEIVGALVRLSPVGFAKEIHFPAVSDTDV